MSLKVNKVKLIDGTEFSPSAITLIVGANNCGKTRFLKEVQEFLLGNLHFEYKILRSISADPGVMDDILDSFNVTQLKTPDESNTTFNVPSGYFEGINQGGQTKYFNTLRDDILKTDPLSHGLFKSNFGKILFAMIKTEDRLIAAKRAQVHPDSLGFLDTVYDGKSALDKKVSSYVFDSFGVNITLDFSRPGVLAIRVGDDFSKLSLSQRDDKGLLEKYSLLEDQGDGLRSFTTTLFMLLVTKRPFILIDEPEAFLHPPQAAALGRIIGELVQSSQHIFISTHSADFLRGVIAKRPDANIVRLTRNTNETKGHLLDTSEIDNILKTPLLNSSRVLESLFYRGAVIMEGDSDRTFYEKIAKKYFPDDEIHYIHAHNKQTTHKLLVPYAKANVRSAIVVDFDVLRERFDLKRIVVSTGDEADLEEIMSHLEAIQSAVNKNTSESLYKELVQNINTVMTDESKLQDIDSTKADKSLESEKRMADIKSKLKKFSKDADKWAAVKAGGMNALPRDVQTVFTQLDKLCRKIGIFIVPCGSLENWLEKEGLSGSKNNKSGWIAEALTWVDENNPKDLGVKDFVQQIHRFILGSEQ